MSMKSLIRSPLAIAAALLAGTAAVAGAQQRVLRWSGQVDRAVDITIRGGQAYTSGQDSRDRRGSVRVQNGIPRENGQLSVRLLEGRGSAYVVQQPSRSNDYTAIVRVEDPQSGVGEYRLETYWRGRGYGNGNGVGRGGNGRYGTRANNGRYGTGQNGNGGLKGEVEGNRGYDNGGLKGQVQGNGGYGGSYNRGSMHGSMSWSGTVDDQAEIRIQGSRANTVTLTGAAVRDVRVGSLRSGLPSAPVQVSVSQSQGRGQAWVVQQPSAQNGYTAVIRIRDPQAGASFYNLNVSW